MTTFTANVPATVSIRVQGFEADIDVTSLPESALAAMVTYGVRRKYQDSINSAAKELRDAGDSPDGADLFEAFHQRVIDGMLGVRAESASADPLDRFRKAIVRGIISRDKSSKAWKGYAAIDSADRKARDEYLLDLAAKNAEKINPLAEAELEREREAAKATASLSL
jgi:hypothetical protein